MAGFDMGSLLNNLLGGKKQQAGDASQSDGAPSGGQPGGGRSGGGLGGVLNADMLAKLGPMLSSLMAGGGMAKLMGQLKGGGLGDQAKSWVASDQENKPVTGEELSGALGTDTISKFANQLGMTNEQAADTMAQTLPGVVDAMTPDGHLPEGAGAATPAGAASAAGGASASSNRSPNPAPKPGPPPSANQASNGRRPGSGPQPM